MILTPVSVPDLLSDEEYLIRFDYHNGLIRNYLAVWRIGHWDDVVPEVDDVRFHRMWDANEASITVYHLPVVS